MAVSSSTDAILQVDEYVVRVFIAGVKVCCRGRPAPRLIDTDAGEFGATEGKAVDAGIRHAIQSEHHVVGTAGPPALGRIGVLPDDADVNPRPQDERVGDLVGAGR